jgi:hypothetical protein
MVSGDPAPYYYRSTFARAFIMLEGTLNEFRGN